VLLATPAQLLSVAKSEIRPSEATIVLVGDVKKLEPLLRKLPGLQAAPQYRDLDGNAQ
jgi:predicted Zn-dependent peptidase